MKRMSILFLVSRLGIGGIQTFVIQLANYLIRNNPNLKIGIYCHLPEGADLKSNIRLDERIKIYTLTKSSFLIKIINKTTHFSKKLNSAFDLKDYLSSIYYSNIVKKYKIDIIHSNIYITDKLAISSKREFSIPFVSTSHGSYDEKGPSNRKVKLMKELAASCDMYVYMAEKNLHNFSIKEIELARKQFIPYGFCSDYPRRTHSTDTNNEAGIKFCMVARGAKDKGWMQLNNAVLLLQEQNLNFEVHVAADGQFVEKLFSNRQREKIYYYGPVTDSLPIIEKCDVGMLPTYHENETMPFTIIEYLYHGKPVISTDLGSIKYMITYKEEVAGEILDYQRNGADVNKLAYAMKNFIVDKNRLLHKSKLAALAFEKFEIGICGANYLHLYQKVLEK